MPQVFAPSRVIDFPNIAIDEFVGAASSGTKEISIAKVTSKGIWEEAWQTPEFDEYVVMLRGVVHIEHADGVTELNAGQALLLKKGERVKWKFPSEEGAEYIPICLPAFTPDNCHREE